MQKFIQTLPKRRLHPNIQKALAVLVPALFYASIFERWTR